MADGFMNIHLPSLARNRKYVAIGHLFAPISKRRSQNLEKRASISPEPYSSSYKVCAKGSCFAAIVRIEDVLRSTQSQLMIWSLEQKVKAA